MNQIVINVQLTVIGEEDVLVFAIDEENPDKYIISLNSPNNQSEIKKVFSKILEMLFDNDITLQLQIADGYSKGLYKDVCEEYINELQKEISEVKEQLIKQTR
ncbi:MAG: hypothetical protein IJA02_07230 [Clostridia bacterium]|nr:hypothetical protein [Clostridia bacterium]